MSDVFSIAGEVIEQSVISNDGARGLIDAAECVTETFQGVLGQSHAVEVCRIESKGQTLFLVSHWDVEGAYDIGDVWGTLIFNDAEHMVFTQSEIQHYLGSLVFEAV